MSTLVAKRSVWLVAAACLLLGASLAGAADTRVSIIVPVSQLHGLAAANYPGMRLPTRLPPKVAFADVGSGCPTSTKLGAPPCLKGLHYTTRRTGCCKAFEVAVYSGKVASSVLQALRRHDGKFGSVSSFKAGRFTGTKERQWDKTYKVGGVDSYVWQDTSFTYVLMVRFLDSGAQAFLGTVPLDIVASFAAGSGSPTPVAPPAASVKMPNLVGLTVAAAIAAGFKAGLDVRRINDVAAPTPGQVGLVISTVPAAGASLPYGSIVTINVGA